MASLEEIRSARLKKLDLLKNRGMDPYPAKVPKDLTLKEAKTDFKKLSTEGKTLSLSGRVMAIRGQGAIMFAVLDDGTATFQAVVKKDALPPDLFSLFTETVDMGDIVSVSGTLFVTQRGEESVLVSSWLMASKSLLPLPEKWHGLTDDDERYRKRYLDILVTPELRDIFYKKSQFWEVTRRFLVDRGFLEVETPTLEVTTGGAEARPFATHHNDYDLDVYLRISVGELWQKRLMAAGFPKTFEIGRAYRNEGSSPDHLQEFTNMEFYWSYANYRDGMKLVEDLYRTIAREVFGTTKFSTRGHTFDLAEPWQEIRYVDAIRTHTGIDVLTASEQEMKSKLHDLGVSYEGVNRERLTDTLWKYVRKKLSGPVFITHHPVLVSALAKESRSIPGTVERFQVLIAGSEVGNGYSELNDPIDQRARFDNQQRLLDAGDEEAMMPDYEFVEMLEHGMPPTCGFGFGERFFAFLVDKPLREVQMFPLMRPKDVPRDREDKSNGENKIEKAKTKKPARKSSKKPKNKKSK